MSSTYTSHSSALSGRIASVLATSYVDNDIRESLRLLDLQGFEVTERSRRDLKLDIDEQLRECNGEIIDDFGKIAEQLERVSEKVARLKRCCDQIKGQITAAHGETRQVTKEASSLLKQKQEVETKQALLKAFRATYLMSESDVAALTSTAEPVDDVFFETLARAKSIHRDCEVLLGEENQNVGMELMDQTSRHLNLAYQKLYRYVQREFKGLDFEEPHITPLLRRSLRVLAERPTLFQSCVDSFAEAREHVIPDAFQAALTGQKPNGELTSDKPIELAAADPLRYVGDMLAWTHAAVASEKETLESIFISDQAEISKSIQSSIRNEPWIDAEGEGESVEETVFDGRRALIVLVNHNIRGVARNLRQRIEQVIRASEEASLSYQLSNLLAFYRLIFSRILGEDSDFLPILTDLAQSSLRHFRLLVHDDLLALQSDLPDIDDDLSPPPFLATTLSSLATLLRSFDTSLDPSADKESEIAPILNEALTPFLDVAIDLSADLPELPQTVYRLNCFLAVGPVLSPFPFTHACLKTLSPRVSALTSHLIDAQHAYFLHTSGLHPLLSALAAMGAAAETPTKQQLLAIPTLDAFATEALREAARKLDDFLPSAVMDARARLERLTDGELAERVTAEGAERFMEDFESVEGRMEGCDYAMVEEEDEREEVEDEEGGRRAGLRLLKDSFPRTIGEVRVLLG